MPKTMKPITLNIIVFVLSLILGGVLTAWLFPRKACSYDCNNMYCPEVSFIDLPAQEVEIKPIPPIIETKIITETKYIQVMDESVRDSIANYYKRKQRAMSTRYNERMSEMQRFVDQLTVEYKEEIVSAQESKQINSYAGTVDTTTYTLNWRIDVQEGTLYGFKHAVKPKLPVLTNTRVVDNYVKRKNSLFATAGILLNDQDANYSVGIQYRRGVFMGGAEYYPEIKAVGVRAGIGVQF